MNLDVVILAAGKGTRMRSQTAKVLHPLAGKPLLHHVIETAKCLQPQALAVVIGHQGDEVRNASNCLGVTHWIEQKEQLGTGHAVQQAMPALSDSGSTIVLYGDVPLVSTDTLAAAVKATEAGDVGLVVATLDDPAELGRIVRDGTGAIQEIVEFKDATEELRKVSEINSGIVAVPTQRLAGWLDALNTDNAQGELYLTDIIAMAVRDGVTVQGIDAEPREVIGINDRAQLAEVERIYQRLRVNELMAQGVTVADPARVDLRGDVQIGADTFLDINVVLSGRVRIGSGVTISAGAVISDSEIGDGTFVHPHTVVEGARVGNNCSLGPFARIRPNTILEERVKIGNFVETKKTHLGAGSKASHLAYLGDATMGENCNVGAGAITANYDGVSKFETRAGAGVFVGTNVTMVAPLDLGDNAFLAAGSTVTNAVEAGGLAVARGKQRNISGWVRPDQRKSETE